MGEINQKDITAGFQPLRQTTKASTNAGPGNVTADPKVAIKQKKEETAGGTGFGKGQKNGRESAGLKISAAGTFEMR